MTLDPEGLLPAVVDLDLAGLLGLNPDRCLGIGDVAQQRTEDEIGHSPTLPNRGNFQSRPSRRRTRRIRAIRPRIPPATATFASTSTIATMMRSPIKAPTTCCPPVCCRRDLPAFGSISLTKREW